MKTPNLTRRALVTALAGVALTASLGVLAQGFQVHYRVAGIVPASEPVPETSFTSHTFTNCGQSWKFGPSLAQCRAAYSGTEIINNDYGFVVSGGIQSWNVPVDGIYRIEAWGASSGSKGIGKGARMRGDFILTRGDVINIVVGQQGGQDTVSSGGGGGSFVWRNVDISPLVVAGGGGGVYNTSTGTHSFQHAVTGTNARRGDAGSGGTNGHGGKTRDLNDGKSGWGGGGGGWLSSGIDGRHLPGSGGKGRSEGFIGGDSTSTKWSFGGFGGGGGTHGNTGGGGGGGGYSGGGGGNHNSSGYLGIGGGGGSYNAGTNQSNQSGVNSGHGRVTITLLSQ